MNSLIRADLFVIDRLAQPVVNWLGRTWGIELGQVTACLAALVFVAHLAFGAGLMMREASLVSGVLAAVFTMVGGVWCLVIVAATRAAESFRVNHNIFRLFPSRAIMWFSAIFQSLVPQHPARRGKSGSQES